MSEVLVVAELLDGAVTKPTLELLTLARRLGDPVAVVFGDGAEAAADRLGEYGATRIVAVTDPAIAQFLVAPKAEALQQLAAAAAPAAILISSSAEGKEIAGRLAIKLGSGLITDATDIAADGTTTQSVFAGNWKVTASITQGSPVITVKPNALAPEPAPASPAVEQAEVTISDQAKTARIVATEPKAGQRPARTHRGGGRRLRRPRHRRELRSGRRARRRPGRGGRRLPGRRRLGLVPPRVPGGPDRQDRVAPALHRRRHLRSHPAPGRDADLQGDRGREQGLRGPDLRAGRPGHRGRSAHRAARRRGGDQATRLSLTPALVVSRRLARVSARPRPTPAVLRRLALSL